MQASYDRLIALAAELEGFSGYLTTEDLKARDLVRRGRASPEHRHLPGINLRCAIFSGLIDAKHRGRVGPAVTGAPRTGHEALRVARKAIRPAPASDRIAFQPAIETPRNSH